MEDWEFKDRYGVDPSKKHARLRPMYNPLEDIPSRGTIEWEGTQEETVCRLQVSGIGDVLVHWRGARLEGISLKEA